MKKTTINQAEKLRLKLTEELTAARRQLAALKRAGLVNGNIYERREATGSSYMMLNTTENGRRRRLYLGAADSKKTKAAAAGIERHTKAKKIELKIKDLERALSTFEDDIKGAIWRAESLAKGQNCI